MSMSISYELTGRTGQKARTRDALIAAARELLAQGVTPTIEEAATAASISRATAYRYFPTQRALLVATHPEIEARSLLGDDSPPDPLARLDAVTAALATQVIENEPELRTMLRLSLEPDPEEQLLRQGRRIAWVEDALAPLRDKMPEAELRRLVTAIGAAVGIEPFVWLTDMAKLTREQAVDVMRSSARTLLRAAVDEGIAAGC